MRCSHPDYDTNNFGAVDTITMANVQLMPRSSFFNISPSCLHAILYLTLVSLYIRGGSHVFYCRITACSSLLQVMNDICSSKSEPAEMAKYHSWMLLGLSRSKQESHGMVAMAVASVFIN